MKHVTSFTILIVIASFLLLSCNRPGQEWRATTEKVDGVTVVKNPENPKFGQISPELEENLVIGNEKDENFRFYRVYSITLDSEENIYVLDSGNCRVQKFDKEGNYLLTYGRKGQGPGEFTNPAALFIDGQNDLHVSEGRKLQAFDVSGKYKKSITLDNNIQEFFTDKQGNILTHCIVSDGEGSKKRIVKFNREGKALETLAEFSDVQAVQNKAEGGRTVTFKAYHQYNYWPYIYPIDADSFVYAYPSDYKIYVMASDGSLSLVLGKEEAPSPISREEKDFIMDGIERRAGQRRIKLTKDVLEAACQFPPHRPYFQRIMVDDTGRIYVRRARSVLDRGEGVLFDVFGKDGFYLYRLELPFTPEVIHKGNLYDVFTSAETGEVRIKRYSIKGWDQIKTGI